MSDPLHTTDLESMLRPDPRRHASRILAWALCWPWNLVWTFCVHNPFRYIIEFLVAEIGGAFDEISRGQFREIERDLLVDVEETVQPAVKRQHEPRRFLFFKRRSPGRSPAEDYLDDFPETEAVSTTPAAAAVPAAQVVNSPASTTGHRGQPAAATTADSATADPIDSHVLQQPGIRQPAGYPATVRYIHQSASDAQDASRQPVQPAVDDPVAKSWDTNSASADGAARAMPDAKPSRVWTPPPVSFRNEPPQTRSGASTDRAADSDSTDQIAPAPADMWMFRPAASEQQASGR